MSRERLLPRSSSLAVAVTSILALAASHGPAQAAELRPWNFAQVKTFLAEHPEIQSVDQFIASLDPHTRNKFVLIHDSHSLHRRCATADNPRVIFNIGQTDKLYVAVANPSGLPGCNATSVEFMEYREDRAAFELHNIEFSPGSKPAISETNPRRCLTCHSSDPHPIWGSYFNWGGTYGSLDDTMLTRDMLNAGEKEPFPIEYEGYERFMAEKRHSGIYRHLNWANGRDQLNQGRPKEPVTGTPHGHPGYSVTYRPNFIFQRSIKYKNQQRISRLLRQDPGFQVFKYAMYYGQHCALVSGIEEIVSSLPPEAQKELADVAIPKAIPKEVEQEFYRTWNLDLIRPYNALAVHHIQRYQIAEKNLERTLPRYWWGYLRHNDPRNPTNTELPRYPGGVSLGSGEYLASVEYFLNVQGKSSKTWWTPLEGYPGTDGEPIAAQLTLVDVDQLSCDQVKAKAVERIAGWAKSRLAAKARLRQQRSR